MTHVLCFEKETSLFALLFLSVAAFLALIQPEGYCTLRMTSYQRSIEDVI